MLWIGFSRTLYFGSGGIW